MLEPGAGLACAPAERQHGARVVHRQGHAMALEERRQFWQLAQVVRLQTCHGLRRRMRHSNIASFLHLFPELGEDVGQRLQGHRDVLRVVQREAFHPAAMSAQRHHSVLHRQLGLELFRGVLGLRSQDPAPQIGHQGREHLLRCAFQDVQATAHVLNGALQIGHALPQESGAEGACFAMAPTVFLPEGRVNHVGKCHVSPLERFLQSGVVVKAEVVSEPMKGGHVKVVRGCEGPHPRDREGLVAWQGPSCPRSGRPCQCVGFSPAGVGSVHGSASTGC